MTDWIERADDSVLEDLPDWQRMAAVLDEKDPGAGERRLYACLANRLRWLRANHAPSGEFRDG